MPAKDKLKHIVHRRAQGLTLRELGEEYDLSPQHISRLLNSSYSLTKNIIKNPAPEEYSEE